MFPLSILATQKAYLPWFHSTHIQLFTFPGEGLKFYTQPFCTQHQTSRLYYPHCPLLDVQNLDGVLLERWGGDPIDQVMACIDAGYYVQLAVDFFYLPCRAPFGRAHFADDVLVSGYDTARQVLAISGFNAQGRYGLAPVEFTNMTQALSTPKECYFEDARGTGQLPPWFGAAMIDRPRVFLYRYRTDTSFRFDPGAVAEQLEDYLESRDSAKRHRWLANSRPGGIWGLETYRALAAMLHIWKKEPAGHSSIPLHVFWEHKTCMLGRLRYMEEEGYLPAKEGIARAYAAVEKKANRARLIELRWRTTRMAGALAKAAAILLETMVLERPLLGRVVTLLRHYRS
jgi:hypothetical protein